MAEQSWQDAVAKARARNQERSRLEQERDALLDALERAERRVEVLREAFAQAQRELDAFGSGS
jgi:hypothetical protein